VTPDIPETESAVERLRRAVDFISIHFAEEITVSNIAGTAGLSTFHFTRMFREMTGESPYQYLIRVRVDRAKQLLVENDHLNVAAVSIAVGFPNQGHFSRHFKRRTGQTPTQFRRASKNRQNRRKN
jgi:AraC family transcriptional regulator